MSKQPCLNCGNFKMRSNRNAAIGFTVVTISMGGWIWILGIPGLLITVLLIAATINAWAKGATLECKICGKVQDV